MKYFICFSIPKMPLKMHRSVRRVVRPRHTRRHRVKGGSLMSWIKTKAYPWIRDKAIPYIKQNKLISRGASAIANILPPEFAGIAQGISKGASAIGMGRRISRRYLGLRRKHGGALLYRGMGLGYGKKKR